MKLTGQFNENYTQAGLASSSNSREKRNQKQEKGKRNFSNIRSQSALGPKTNLEYL